MRTDFAPVSEAGGSGTRKTSSSVHDVSEEKPPFGSRFLTDEVDVWSQNAWDHVPPPDGQEEVIAAALARQRTSPIPETEKSKYNEMPSRHWDNFYKMNSSNFFRNRKWLHLEFSELAKAAESEAGSIVIAEIGCGAGNAVFPLLSSNSNPHLDLHAYDYSSHAVKLVQTNPLYLSPPVGSIRAAMWDLSSSTLPPDVKPESIDIVILVFVLSALHPDEWRIAITNIHKMLKPGGLVLFRDYGRHDLTQLRFKGGRLLDENFYIRGDKTRVYFFELDELALLFTGSPAPPSSKADTTVKILEDADDTGKSDHPSSPSTTSSDSHGAIDSELSTPSLGSSSSCPSPLPLASVHPSLLHAPQLAAPSSSNANRPAPHPLFAIEQLCVDRRLIVNRKRQLKMYRVWMQGKFRKLAAQEAHEREHIL
ncbi:hypothetical protein AcV7_003074 [Taiwanofungus camphoratus]|nr:hypothetical protein AcV7_003074 [Antrodia cinnamomea]